jgi:hypothetical protein
MLIHSFILELRYVRNLFYDDKRNKMHTILMFFILNELILDDDSLLIDDLVNDHQIQNNH